MQLLRQKPDGAGAPSVQRATVQVPKVLAGNKNGSAASAQQTFEQGGIGGELPAIEIPRADIDNELGVVAAFVTAGLVKSNGEAKRQIQGGGLRVNDVAVGDEKAKLTPKDITKDGIIKLSLGKKKHVLFKPV